MTEQKKIRMPQDIKDKWVAALRSGKYKQGKEMLLDHEGNYTFKQIADIVEEQVEGYQREA